MMPLGMYCRKLKVFELVKMKLLKFIVGNLFLKIIFFMIFC